jgi:hypothetical protein
MNNNVQLKGKIETTIPQRQYENVKTTYYFNNDEERQMALDRAIDDCLVLNNKVRSLSDTKENQSQAQSLAKENEVLPKKSELTTMIDGVPFRKVTGGWEYQDPETKKWMKAKSLKVDD